MKKLLVTLFVALITTVSQAWDQRQPLPLEQCKVHSPFGFADSAKKYTPICRQAYFVAYDAMNTYPEDLTLDYNIWEYLSFDHDLIQAPATYRLEFPEDKTMSFERFLELFYFARRRNFGKTTVERVGDKLSVVDAARRGSAAARGKTTSELATVVIA